MNIMHQSAHQFIAISCEIQELVSFLNSTDFLNFLSIFHRGKSDYKAICNLYHGVFRWPLLRWVEKICPGKGNRQRILYPRKCPGNGALALFPQMQELVFDSKSGGPSFPATSKALPDPPISDRQSFRFINKDTGAATIEDSCYNGIQKSLFDLRAALGSGRLGRLEKLTIKDVYVDTANAGALILDLPTILRRGHLKNLSYLKLDVVFKNGESILGSAAADELIRAMSKTMPLLRDFELNIEGDINVSDAFFSRPWPSLEVLRSAFLTRSTTVNAPRAWRASTMNFAAAWALGHFPSATTLVVSEWKHSSTENIVARNNLLLDLPTDGMPQITQLVLMGRLLKNPLLNFRVAGSLTAQEAEFGGGGVIQAPPFSKLQTLDVSRLFVTAAYSQAKVLDQGFAGAFYDLYAASFGANTCRALNNIGRSLLVDEASPAPLTLVISDAFFGTKDGDATVQAADALSDCLAALRPSKLVVLKVGKVSKSDVASGFGSYFGQQVLLRRDSMPADFSYGQWPRGCAYRGTVPGKSGSSDPMSPQTREMCGNLHRLLSACGPALQHCLAELEVDSLYLHSHRSLLRSQVEEWLKRGLFSALLKEEEGRGKVAVAMFFLTGKLDSRDPGCSWEDWFKGQFAHFTKSKVMQASESSCSNLMEIVLGGGAASAPVFDFRAALLPLKRLRKLVVDNSRRGDADREMLCSLPSPGCEALVVREARQDSPEAEREARGEWEALIKALKAVQPEIPSVPKHVPWKKTSLALSVETQNGDKWHYGEIRSLWE